MSICPYCGVEDAADAPFCAQCGQDLSAPAPVASAPVKPLLASPARNPNSSPANRPNSSQTEPLTNSKLPSPADASSLQEPLPSFDSLKKSAPEKILVQQDASSTASDTEKPIAPEKNPSLLASESEHATNEHLLPPPSLDLTAVSPAPTASEPPAPTLASSLNTEPSPIALSGMPAASTPEETPVIAPSKLSASPAQNDEQRAALSPPFDSQRKSPTKAPPLPRSTAPTPPALRRWWPMALLSVVVVCGAAFSLLRAPSFASRSGETLPPKVGTPGMAATNSPPFPSASLQTPAIPSTKPAADGSADNPANRGEGLPSPETEAFPGVPGSLQEDVDMISLHARQYNYALVCQNPGDNQLFARLKVRLEGADRSSLRLYRNGIYARRGYIFTKNLRVAEHFRGRPWYRGTSNNAGFIYQQVMNANERDNIAFIQKLEASAP